MDTGVLVKTDRLLVRTLQPGDVEPLVALWTDPEVTRYMGGPRDRDRLRGVLEEDAAADAPPAFDLWPVVERASGEVIGQCGLIDKEVDAAQEYELVYVLRRPAWGRGYATEVAGALCDYVFAAIGLQRLIALIDPENTASARVARKVGMRFEKGILRPGGKLMHVYAIEVG